MIQRGTKLPPCYPQVQREYAHLNTLLPPRAKKQTKEDEMDLVGQKEPPLAKLITKATATSKSNW